ncbi:MAG TPA: DUF885 domain-containing protein, partial [Demequina sp.]|nr:DUF885 domain-containing protein [Demequina sp.]
MTTISSGQGATRHREASPIDAIADAYVATSAALDPLAATAMGIAGHDHEMTDLSPAGHAARAEAARSTLVALDAHAPSDATDEVTLAAMQERLGLELELDAAGETLADLNNIASPVQGLRDVFDLMPTGSIEGWENIAARLGALPGAVDGYVESLRESASRGRVAAIRQVRDAIAQAGDLADPKTSFFTSFVHGPTVDLVLDDSSSCSLVRAELERGATAARGAYATLTAFLRDELAPQAPAADAAGRDRYALWSRYFLGATVDLEETYQWGLEELARVIAEQERVAEQIAGPGATVEQAVAVLDADPALTLHGTAELRAWMQETSDAAIAALNGTHFDIPVPVQTLECRIAPTQNGGIYYTGPSDDFSRPGRMWWSVPPSVTTFNTWRRLASWTSGHGEGWALYAERLMADLGFLDNPGDRLGMLDGQRMRAARVVLDIGVHLGLPAPERWGGGTWDADKAWE